MYSKLSISCSNRESGLFDIRSSISISINNIAIFKF